MPRQYRMHRALQFYGFPTVPSSWLIFCKFGDTVRKHRTDNHLNFNFKVNVGGSVFG